MAVQIVRVNHGRLHVNNDAFGKILDKVGANPVAVVAVSDPLQRGKSSIINRLLLLLTATKDSDEDSLDRATITEVHWKREDDQPNEILMWPEPLMANHNGRSTAVLLMSVHGNLDDTIITMDNALIFAFGCLLASVTIYHVKDGIPEDMLQFLQMTIASVKAISQQDDWNPFAKLLFVVSNWQCPGDYNYGYHEDLSMPSMSNFKKEQLNVQTGRMLESNVVRQEILSSFQEVCCCLVPCFSDDIMEVQEVDPLQDLGRWIFRNGCSICKTVKGKEVTGVELKSLVQEWAGSLTTSKIVAFRTEVEAPGEVQTAMALSVALKFFRLEMTTAFTSQESLSDDQRQVIHATKKRSAVAMFQRLSTQPEEVQQRWVDILDAEFVESSKFLLMDKKNGRYGPPPLLVQSPVVMARQRQENRTCLKIFLFVVIAKVIIAIAYFAWSSSDTYEYH